MSMESVTAPENTPCRGTMDRGQSAERRNAERGEQA